MSLRLIDIEYLNALKKELRDITEREPSLQWAIEDRDWLTRFLDREKRQLSSRLADDSDPDDVRRLHESEERASAIGKRGCMGFGAQFCFKVINHHPEEFIDRRNRPPELPFALRIAGVGCPLTNGFLGGITLSCLR